MNSSISDITNFWKIVDSSEKFETLSYLLMSVMYPDNQWYKTPKTRDGKRDGETHIGTTKVFYESKYFQRWTDKLSHEKIGASINIAIIEMAETIWIVTNGEIQRDLLTFIQSHNDIHEAVLKKPLKIKTINGRQFSLLFMNYPYNLYFKKLDSLKLIGYKTKKSDHIIKNIKEIQDVTLPVLRQVESFKDNILRENFSFPTISSIIKNNWSNEEKIRFLSAILNVHIEISCHQQKKLNSEVVIGIPFCIQVYVQNLFFDTAEWRIFFKPKGLIFLGGRTQHINNEFVIEGHTQSTSEEIVTIPARIERHPFEELQWTLTLNQLELDSSAIHIKTRNIFFYAPFVGERNNALLGLFNEKIDYVYYRKKFLLGLITGRAGVGKSRFIQEVCYHAQQFEHKLFHANIIASQGQATVVKKLIAFCCGFTDGSFEEIGELVLRRFQTDKNFSDLFSSKDELKSFIRAVEKISSYDFNRVDTHEVKLISSFLNRLLIKLSHKYLLIIIIEDLHLGGKILFDFITQIYNQLKLEQTKVALIMAARTEIKEQNSAFLEFQSMINSDPTYSILNLEIKELTERDSLSLIKELVYTESKFDDLIERKIRAKTGNNPFNIIHTLLHLKNLGVIVEKNQDFEWRHIEKLNGIILHEEVFQLFNDRFRFYKENVEYGNSMILLIQVLCILESSVSIQQLKTITKLRHLEKVLDLAVEENIIKLQAGKVSFTHENIFNFVNSHLIEGSLNAAGLILDCIDEGNNIPNKEGLMVRCLSILFDEKNSIRFFNTSINYFFKAKEEDNWKVIDRYGSIILEKAEYNSFGFEEKLFEVELTTLIVKSETGLIDEVIYKFDMLADKINQYLINKNTKVNYQAKSRIKLIELKVKIQTADVIIMSSKYCKALIRLKLIRKELEQLLEEKKSKNSEVLKLLCWTLNRIGVALRGSGQPLNGFIVIKKSLELSMLINHPYYIHHNYYDMAGCQFCLNNIDKAIEYHQKCYNKEILRDNPNALARTTIRSGTYFALLDNFEKAEIEFEKAIIIARDKNYLWELTRGLINMGSMYFRSHNLKQAHQCYNTCMHFVDIHGANVFKLCLYTNLSFLHLKYFLDNKKDSYVNTSFDFMKKVVDILKNPILYDPLNLSVYEQIALYNIYSWWSIIKEINPIRNSEFPQVEFFLKEWRSSKEQLKYLDFYKYFEHYINKNNFLLMFMSYS